jgi:cystathionine beta-synthase
LGAEVIVTRSDVGKGHPEYYQDLAARLAAEQPDSWFVNQFANPANPRAHELGTGPEILAQMEGRVDAVICGVGSGGTVTGLSRCFAVHSPATELVLADPEGSVLANAVAGRPLGEAGSWQVEGSATPAAVLDRRVRQAYTISDAESIATARRLLRREGILAGSSTGCLLAAALRYCREQTAPKRVLTFACDTGNKYLSKFYDDAWLIAHGLPTDEESLPA